MKIFYYAPYRGQKYFSTQYKKIYDLIKSSEFELINQDAIADTDAFFKEIDSIGLNGYLKTYNRLHQNLKSCDISIFETSFPSLALDYNKPVIALQSNKGTPSFFLAVTKDEKFQFVEYDEDNLKTKINTALANALDLREKRFNFFVSPEMLTYLEIASKKDGITKSSFIRSLINEHRKKKNK